MFFGRTNALEVKDVFLGGTFQDIVQGGKMKTIIPGFLAKAKRIR